MLSEKQRLRLQILEKINSKIDLNIPKFLLEQELDKMQNELEQQVSSMGISLEKYLENAKQDIKNVRSGWEEKAKNRILQMIILRLIADKEKIEVSEKEIEEEVNKYLQQFTNIKAAKEAINPVILHSYINGIIKNKKVFELLENDSDIANS